MKKYFCDVCGLEVDSEDIAEVIALGIAEEEKNEEVETFGELCFICRKEMRHFLEKIKEREQKKGDKKADRSALHLIGDDAEERKCQQR